MKYSDILSYDASTGDLRLKIDKLRTKAGEIATTQGGRGYLKFEWKGEKQYAHRLAWLLHYGEWPSRNIDHINGDKSDNRIANLRLCDHQQNGRNRSEPGHNTSGVKGVYWDAKRDRWCSEIMLSRKKRFLGSFAAKYDAIIARKQAELKHFGEFRYGALRV